LIEGTAEVRKQKKKLFLLLLLYLTTREYLRTKAICFNGGLQKKITI
jgi:hypothetical protein